MNSKLLLNIFLSFKFKIFLLCLLAILIGSTDGAIPFFVKYLFDEALDQGKNFPIFFILLFMLLGFARSALNYLYINYAAKVGNQVIYDIRQNLFRAILNLSPSKIQNLGGSRLSSTVINDTIFLKELVVNNLPEFIRDILRLLALTVASLWLDWRIALSVLFIAPVLAILVQKISKSAKRLSNSAQAELGRLTSVVVSVLLGFKSVKSFNLEVPLNEVFLKLAEANRAFSTKADVAKNISVPINEFLVTLLLALILFFGIHQISSGKISQGEFFGVLATLGLLYDPIKKLSKTKAHISSALGALDRVASTLNETSDIEGKKVNHLSNFDIQISNLRFSYGSNLILNNFSLVIPYGSKVTLVGTSGIGKSTLADLLFGFAKPEQGSIKIGGVDVTDIDFDYLRQIITYIPQAPVFFEQIGLRNFGNNLNEAELCEIFRSLNCDHLFERLKQNKIDEYAGDVSGGEKQRIFLAGALAKNSKIYIFDEITSSLDVETEKIVLDIIFKNLREKTVVFITHRFTALQYSDLVIDLSDCKTLSKRAP